MFWVEVLGHVSNVMYLLGSGFKKIVLLRISLVIAGSLELIYFILTGGDDLLVSIIWGFLFVLINLVMIALYIFERKTLSLNDDEARLYYMVFPQMEKVIYKRLLKAGRWIHFNEGTILIKEHEHTENLMILFEGKVQIDVAGKHITVLNPGSFIGEMSLLSGGNATATVTSITEVKLYSWDKISLTKLLKSDKDMEMELMKIFSSDLVNKLVKVNQ